MLKRNKKLKSNSVLKKTPLKKQQSKIPKFTKDTVEKRKKEREGYSKFYLKHIEKIKSKGLCCEECGDKLKGYISEVAHILSKENNPEVAMEDKNIVYLCNPWTYNDCHSKFDSSFKVRKKMKVFEVAKQKFKSIEDKVKNITPEVLIYK